MRKIVLLPVLAFMFLAAPACKNSEGNAEKTADKANKENLDATDIKKDAEFAVKAASGGMMEVELGNLAQSNGSSAAVKDFGKQMVTDHSQGNDELKSIAAAKNITLPAAVDGDKRKMIDDLKKKTGADFDKSYIDMMVSDHKDDIDEFQKEGNNGNDGDIKTWASGKVGVLQHHLEMAQSIQDQLKKNK